MKKILIFIIIILNILIVSCDDSDNSVNPPNVNSDTGGSSCNQVVDVDDSKGACSVTLSEQNQVSFTESGGFRIITSNNIPNHDVGLFGGGPGSLNPNPITTQNSTYQIDLTPSKASNNTQLLNNGPVY